MRTRLLATSVAVLLALTLAGCSDDPQPIIEPAPSTTAAPSVTPNETPSSTPTPEAEPESAKDFIRRWQTATYAMQDSGDVSNYLAMTDECSSCDALADEVTTIYADGRSIRTSGGRILEVERVGKVKKVFIYEYVARSGPSAVLARDGSAQRQFEGGTARFQMNLTRHDESWLVGRVSRLSS